jgi:beta-glucosidase-like glycosyl hydrolase
VLRGEWHSDAVVQSDCCDSLTAIKSQHNYTDTYEEAVAAAFDAGLSLCFGCDPFLDHGERERETESREQRESRERERERERESRDRASMRVVRRSQG